MTNLADRIEALETPRAHWWGDYPLPLRAGAKLRLGPLTLMVERHPWEWRMWSERGEEPYDASVSVDSWPMEERASATAEERRVTFAETADPLHLHPALSDRPVIATPPGPLSVLPGERVTALLSTPVWCRISVGEPRREVHEVPTWRPRDTWFGPTTREGEVCYASRSELLLDPTQVQHLPTRAQVPLQLVNDGKDVLEISRLRLPMPRMALFVDPDHNLWTTRVTLRRQEEEMAQVELDSDPPVQGATLLTAARELSTGPRVVRAFNAFAKGWWS